MAFVVSWRAWLPRCAGVLVRSLMIHGRRRFIIAMPLTRLARVRKLTVRSGSIVSDRAIQRRELGSIPPLQSS